MDIEIIRINMNTKIDNDRPLSACIGYFDGLHKGHQKLVLKVIENSLKYDLRPALITFDPDPVVVTRNLESIRHIMTLEDKMNVAKFLGIKTIVILEIDKEMMQMSPDHFINDILVKLNIKSLVCGFDFRFGYKGQGTAHTLKEYEHLFKVDVIDEVDYNNIKISSTRIIEALKEGKVGEVMTMLGRPFTISGHIIAGNQKGREIGYPTANLQVDPEYHDVKEGVYVTQAYVNHRWYPAMTNVGHNLTFNTSDPVSVETYILNFDEKIYGQSIRLAFYHYLRPELKFEQVSELIHQMDQDKRATQDYFNHLNLSSMDESLNEIVYDIKE